MNPGKLIIYNKQFLWGILIDASMENSCQLRLKSHSVSNSATEIPFS